MKALVADLRAEYDELADYLATLPEGDWAKHTVFYDWTVADEVMHLHQVDLFGLIAMRDAQEFAELFKTVRAGQAQGIELSQEMRTRFGHLAPAEQLAAWRATYDEVLTRFAASDADTRMPWFGPEMGVASFAAARQMEVWAHGQDIYDLFRVRRRSHDRIRAICDLGVRTQGWSFRNRGLDRPAPPHVTLTAPSGDIWEWTPDGVESVTGPAEDFALVVTQRRHVDDTDLVVTGTGARAWMEIAQCFAGKPADGPAPGVRKVDYAA